MADRTCERCGKTFELPCRLRAHQQRKTPCASIVAKVDLSEVEQAKPHACRYCNRRFTSLQGLSQHTTKICKIANSEEGMEKLFEHTLQRQLEDQKTMLEAQQKQMDKLTHLLEGKLALEPKMQQPTAQQAHQIQNNAGPVQNNTTNVIIQNFDAERCLQVPAELVRRLFTTNARLKEFITNGPVQEDAEAAVPYVLEALLQITREVHRDPQQRNV